MPKPHAAPWSAAVQKADAPVQPSATISGINRWAQRWRALGLERQGYRTAAGAGHPPCAPQPAASRNGPSKARKVCPLLAPSIPKRQRTGAVPKADAQVQPPAAISGINRWAQGWRALGPERRRPPAGGRGRPPSISDASRREPQPPQQGGKGLSPSRAPAETASPTQRQMQSERWVSRPQPSSRLQPSPARPSGCGAASWPLVLPQVCRQGSPRRLRLLGGRCSPSGGSVGRSLPVGRSRPRQGRAAGGPQAGRLV